MQISFFFYCAIYTVQYYIILTNDTGYCIICETNNNKNNNFF